MPSPTIKWFKKGVSEAYFGPNEADAIVKAVRREMIRDAAASSTTRLGASAAVLSADMQAVLEEGKGYALVGLFREPIGASSMYRTFSDAAAELPYTIERKVKVAFGAGATAEQLDALKGEFGVKQVPALLLFRPGEEVESMPIPRKRTEFTEEAVASWIKKLLGERN